MSKKPDILFDCSGNQLVFGDDNRLRVRLSFENDPGLTEQSHRDSCDITYIVNQHVNMGVPFSIPEGLFNDLTNLPDYQTALNTVNQIDSLFEDLPLNVRSAFDHNPVLFMQAVEDPSKRDVLVQLGVVTPSENLNSTASQSNSVTPTPEV